MARALPGLRLFERDVVPESEVEPLALEAIRWITLSTGDTTGTSIRDVLLFRDTLIVLDEGLRQVAAFRLSTGKELWRIGGRGPADGEFTTPVRLARMGDTILVADREHRNQISLFDRDGQFLHGFGLRDRRTLNEITTSGGRLFITILSPELGDTSQALVLITDPQGNPVGRGCRRDPDVMASNSAGRILGVFGATGVAAADTRVYCFQHATPVVQVLDSNGMTISTVNLAPPYNAEPKDGPFVMDRQRMLQYLAGSWKPLVHWAPTSSGFVSAYASFDTVSQRSVYPVFSCDTSFQQRQCAGAELRYRPLRFIGIDSILVIDGTATGLDRLKVGIIRMGRR